MEICLEGLEAILRANYLLLLVYPQAFESYAVISFAKDEEEKIQNDRKDESYLGKEGAENMLPF